jgi:hypothetical protein
MHLVGEEEADGERRSVLIRCMAAAADDEADE